MTRGSGPVRHGNGARPSGWRPGADALQTPLPPPPPGIDMDRWRRIVDGIRGEKPALASMLDGAVPLQLTEEQVVLAFPQDGFMSSQASDAASVELLKWVGCGRARRTSDVGRPSGWWKSTRWCDRRSTCLGQSCAT
ncbi:MAG: hypothetical protein MUF34_28985 [Polyangiaceae bacterium]|nr:hypothetical protein [Polyangiaceae bacterium]